MRVFVTGATGFIGLAIINDLLSCGHEVLGLARSDKSAAALIKAGAKVHRGDLENTESLRQGATQCDGVIHTGFIHDFTRFAEVCEVDRLAIEALGAALVGSDRPLIVTAGVALLAPGRFATEDDAPPEVSPSYPRSSEKAAAAVKAMGVNVSVVRLAPSVHGDGDYGFVPMLIKLAREKGISAYIGDGENRWTAVHRFDAARLFRLAFEHARMEVKSDKVQRFHGVADEAIAFRHIAELIGRGLNIPIVSKSPAEASQHFGWFYHFAGMDCPAHSATTRKILNWEPRESTLLADLEHSTGYFAS